MENKDKMIEELKQQLAEKDKEIEQLKSALEYNENNIPNQRKAILHQVCETIRRKIANIENIELSSYMTLCEILDQVIGD